MDIINFPIERLNEFLTNHEFVIANPFGESFPYPGNVTVKVKLTGMRPMISIGEWKNFVEYTLYLENVDDRMLGQILGYVFAAAKSNDITLPTNDTRFYSLTSKVNEILRNFFKYWNVDDYVTCTRIINNAVNIDPKYMTEGVINEGKHDRAIRQVVKDILLTFKYQKEGEYTLPEDIESDDHEMVYDFHGVNSQFTVELYLELDDSIETIDVDGEYYGDDDTIVVMIKSNPNLDRETLELLHFELNELVAHELKHLEQMDSGYKFPKKKIKKSLKYYTQPHELEAQIAGFKRRAQKERKPLIDVIDDWFDKNHHKHGLTDDEIEIVVDKILDSL